MQLKEIGKLAFLVLFHIIIPFIYIFVVINEWAHLTASSKRIFLSIFMILIMGVHRCMTFARVFKKFDHYDIEMTIMCLIIYAINKEETGSLS